jgi:hypothetical protein
VLVGGGLIAEGQELIETVTLVLGEQTLILRGSNTCEVTIFVVLLDYLVGADQKGLRDGKAERFGGLAVDH